MNDWAQFTSTTKDLKIVTRWLMCIGLLGQFSLAADQLYLVQQVRDKDVNDTLKES